MTTYTPNKVHPYVYICREKNSSKFYVGYRFKNKVPAHEDFGQYYFTSSKYVQSNFENFTYKILGEFENRKDALAYESKTIKEMRSKNMLNRDPAIHKPYTRNKTIDSSEKICALPGCEKPHTNWRMKCCCMPHQRKYAALRRHNKV